jgi:hypothetical protein
VPPFFTAHAGSLSNPQIRRARISTSRDSAGSNRTLRLRPWRSALRLTRALPAAVRGPVLARALARLAARLRSLIAPAVFAEPAAVAGRHGGRCH